MDVVAVGPTPTTNTNVTVSVSEELTRPDGCSFYLKKKKRYCKLFARKSQKYCPEHSHLESGSSQTNVTKDGILRITCPHDPKHTVYAHNLEKHLKICGAREPEVRPAYYKLDTNILSSSEPPQIKLKDLKENEIKVLTEKVSSIFKEKIPEIGSYMKTAANMHDIINSPENGQPARRHLTQIATIIDLISKNPQSEKNQTVFVEFGSGKGHVSYWLGLTMKELRKERKCKIVLVDRESHRHKRDNKHTDDQDIEITRIRVDIKDLLLHKVPEVETANDVIAVSKHLCGQATDLGLTCCLTDHNTSTKIAGLVMATCCHHRCIWNSFVGKEFLLEWGFEKEDFYPLISLTSWAVCGTGVSKFNTNTDDEIGTNPIYQNLNLTCGQRRKIGYQAKMILDQARAKYVEKCGLKCNLTTFANEEDTLENILLHAER